MIGMELATAFIVAAAVSLLGWFGTRTRKRSWKRRLARSASNAVQITRYTRRARELERLIRRALGDQHLVESLSRQDQQASEAISAHLVLHLREFLTAEFDDEWESRLHDISRALSENYVNELLPQKVSKLIQEGNRKDNSHGSSQSASPLPPLVEARLREMSNRDEAAVATNLRQWMADPSNRRSDRVTEFIQDPPVMLNEASFLAWEAIGHFVSAYDLGNPQDAYQHAIRCGSPRRVLYQVDEVMRRFDGSNITEASRMLDHLSQDQVLVRVARALVENDMSLVLTRLERGGVCESEDPMVARFGKHVRIGALEQTGDLNGAIDLAREAVQEYPDFSSWRTMCGQLLAFAAQEETTDSARRRRLAEEGMQLALESRDMVRTWGGPSGPAVAVALVCAHLQRDPDTVCRLAMREPVGEATEHEASHSEVVLYLARALGIMGRFDELRELDTSRMGEFDRVIISAWLARADGEPCAMELMRHALSLAEDEVQRSLALYGIASLGGMEDLAADTDLQQQPSEAALLVSLAALENGNLDQALHLIQPHKWDSAAHALQFAHILIERGDIEAAADHYQSAAMRFAAPEFLHSAASLLIEESRFEDAEPLVATGLTRTAEPALRRVLHRHRVNIANQQHDWSEMFQRAETAAAEFPDEVQFRWAAIFALCSRGELERAHRYLQEHPVEVYDHQSLLMEVGLRSRFDASLKTVDWLLELGEDNSGDEEFTAAVLASIFEASQQLELSDVSSSRLNALVGGFLNEFPSSELFFVIEGPNIEALIGEMRALLEPGSVQRLETAEKVSLGLMPFGMMQVASGKPYALALVTGAAGALAAVPLDEEIRRQEQQAASTALNNAVSIDTSSIMFWHQHLGGSPAIMRYFSEILLATELLADIRAAEHVASVPASGTMGFNPATGDIWASETDPQQVQVISDGIGEILFLASRCAHVESTSLTMPESTDVPSQLAPWDASLRVAQSRGCALWTDDAFMRALARLFGVPAFGTYALFEALISTSVAADLPSDLEFKRSLIRSRVADVPLTWAELEAIHEQDGLGSVGFVLERPSSWVNPIRTFRWFRQTLRRLNDEGDAEAAPYVLFSATLGACRATDKDGLPSIAGSLLSAALLVGLPHAFVPELVVASRAACRTLTFDSEIDPLPLPHQTLHARSTSGYQKPAGHSSDITLWASSARSTRTTDTSSRQQFSIPASDELILATGSSRQRC